MFPTPGTPRSLLPRCVRCPPRSDYRQVAPQPPLVGGADHPDFWCRVDGAETIIFFAHPATQRVRYPMPTTIPIVAGPERRAVTLHVNGRRLPLALDFAPEGVAARHGSGGRRHHDAPRLSRGQRVRPVQTIHDLW